MNQSKPIFLFRVFRFCRIKRTLPTQVTLVVIAVIALFTGCSMPRYDLNSSYREEFRSMVQTYQDEASRIAARDNTIRDQQQGDGTTTLEADTLNQDPLFVEGLRVQDDLPSKKITLEDFYIRAINNSAQIRVFSELPLIRETGIQEARGAFDSRVFVESRYDLTDDPVGSTLTTGGPDRLDENRFSVQGGVRKKVVTGAEVFAIQEVSRTDSNSTFFVPDPQASARLRIGAIQPLLHGAGIAYNRSIVHIAEIDSEIARHEFLRQSESHLLEITRTYWTLYMARGVHQAKRRAFTEAVSTVAELESRGDFDTVKRQLLRARAAEAERRASLVRAESAVRNAEDRLKALVNDPEFINLGALEMIPTDAPVITPVDFSLTSAAAAALENRPEILQAFLQLRSAAIREKMQRNELLPVLNLIVEGYVAGLAQDDISEAWDNQFNEGGPGGALGVRFEFPVENNEAIARLDRRKLEMRQLVEQLRATMETVLLEVKVAVREVRTAHRDLQAKHESMLASREDLGDLTRRREVMMLGADTTATGYLEFLIEAQERQSVAEERFLQALATYNVALVTLERSKGNLLKYESITVEREWDEERDLPRLRLQKEPSSAATPAKTTPVSDKSSSKGISKSDSSPITPIVQTTPMESPILADSTTAPTYESVTANVIEMGETTSTSAESLESLQTPQAEVSPEPIPATKENVEAMPVAMVIETEPAPVSAPADLVTHFSQRTTSDAAPQNTAPSRDGFWSNLRNRAVGLFQ